ncbi:MAG TPA: ABC transporter substrate-binding protein [Nocardioides sp.]|jgi:osmoprotectant transport system substrate-binding protein|nr:ABC transporter substrate-binding protein [Nocardioides sp.]
MQTRRLLVGVVALSAALLTACGSSSSSTATEPGAGGSSTAADKGPVRISGQNFTEAEIVADMYAAVLQKAGYDPSVKLVDTRDVYMKLVPDKIDVVPEYTGAIVEFLNGTYNGSDAKPITVSDPQQTIDKAKPLLEKKGVTLLDPSPATDSNAFFVTKKYSEDNGVTTLSGLKGKSVTLAAAPDCKGRLDCEGGLTSAYGIKVTKILPLGYASQQTYDSVLKGESQLGETSTTDGTLESQGLVLLDDDQHIQPAQNLVPMVSSAFLEAHPDVAEPLNALMAKLTTEDLTKLNAEVSVDRQKPEDVAQQWLSDAGLI